MAIEFNCPKCEALIAFAEKHAGRRARCVKCDHRFIIPEASFQRPVHTSQPKDKPELSTPLPGFYHAALVQSWGLLFRSDALMGLALICAAVCFKFYVAHIDYSFVLMDRLSIILPFGLIVRMLCWGFLFWYYMESIMLGALDVEALPDVEIDGYGDFIKKSVGSVFAFFTVLLFSMLPTILYLVITGRGHSPGMANGLVNLGLFFLPMGILAVGVNRDTQILYRIDILFAPVTKAFFPYLTCVAMVMLVWFLQMKMYNAGDPALADASGLIKSMYLSFHLAIQILTLVAMRSLGLYYKHHQCYFKW